MHALKPWLPLKLHDGWCGLRLKDYHDLLLPSVGQNRERERERKRERERERVLVALPLFLSRCHVAVN